MPLLPPYREAVKPSDLAYGLAGPRMRYLDERAAFSGGVDLINNYRISAYEQREKPDVPVREPEFLRVIEQHPKYSSILGKNTIQMKLSAGNARPDFIGGRTIRKILIFTSYSTH